MDDLLFSGEESASSRFLADREFDFCVRFTVLDFLEEETLFAGSLNVGRKKTFVIIT
jgi:hypothetical protein